MRKLKNKIPLKKIIKNKFKMNNFQKSALIIFYIVMILKYMYLFLKRNTISISVNFYYILIVITLYLL